jgi:hypothetical protein
MLKIDWDTMSAKWVLLEKRGARRVPASVKMDGKISDDESTA